MRRGWIGWVSFVLITWLVASHFSELAELPHALRQGHPHWILLAILLQAAYYVLFAYLYQAAMRAVDVQSRGPELLPVILSGMFVNVAVPSLGLAGATVMVNDAAQRGQPAAGAAAGVLLVRVADLCGIALILILGTTWLYGHGALQIGQVVGMLITFGVLAGMAGSLLVGMRNPRALRRLLAMLADAWRRRGGALARRFAFDDAWIDRNAADFSAASHSIGAHPVWILLALGAAMAANFCNVASLYALFRAFDQPIESGALLAGLAVAMLFFVIDLSPQAAGLAEGAMAAVYYALGVPLGTAALVALAWRGLAFWIPVAVGFALLRRAAPYGLRARSRAEASGVRAMALMVAMLGVVSVLSAVAPSAGARLTAMRHVLPHYAEHGFRTLEALTGYALLLLAGNLWRRKRMAWLMSLGLLLVLVSVHVVRAIHGPPLPHAVPALIAFSLAYWLWHLRFHFHAASDPPSVWKGVRVLAASMAFTVTYGVLGYWLLGALFKVPFSLQRALGQTVAMLTQFYDPGLMPPWPAGRWLASSIYTVGIGSFAYSLWMIFKPVLAGPSREATARIKAASVVEAHGRTPLACFALFDDKSYFFSKGGSLVAYAVKGHTAVALGDPIGPAEDVPAALREFKEHARRNDWDTAYYQTMPDHLTAYRDAGYDALCIGNEAIVDLSGFSLSGGTYKSLRTTVNRITRLGHRCEIHEPPLDDALLDELETISNEWLTMMKGTEKRFSLGAFERAYIRACPVVAVHTPDGAVSAFCNILHEFQKPELTVDLMRRRTQIENGTMDFLFATLFAWGKEKGFATFNLGLSPLAGVGAGVADPPSEKAIHFMYQHLNQFYNFKGLHAFKEKFHPTWSPRYLIFQGAAALPTLAVALIRVHSGDDFLIELARDAWHSVQVRR